MTDEVLVAVEALRAAGVERISVGDWHMVGTNIERERMPEGSRCGRSPTWRWSRPTPR